MPDPHAAVGDARPLVHLTPPAGWCNDPNGLVRVGEVFHACYQHHPGGLTWGPMHWGHATSRDLISWAHLPIALAPDRLGDAFSGSAVVDATGSAGHGPGAIIAVFTSAGPGGQVQSLAWSHDGVAFHTDPANPVLAGDVADFRDPKVFRHAGRWVMVIAAGDEVRFHVSDDLHAWHETGRFRPAAPLEGVIETPDLFPLASPGGTPAWLLSFGVIEGAPAGGSGTRAVVGAFDGRTFRATGEEAWVDHGPDFYAAQSWDGVADGRRIWVGWLDNWSHAERFPATTWRGQLTIPRELSLISGVDGRPQLAQVPVRELAAHRAASAPVRPGGPVAEITGPALDIEVRPEALRAGPVEVVAVRTGTEVVVRLDATEGTVSVTCADDLGEALGPLAGAPMAASGAAAVGAGARILVDAASLEVFAGTAAITAQLAARGGAWTVRATAPGATPPDGSIVAHRLEVDPPPPPPA